MTVTCCAPALTLVPTVVAAALLLAATSVASEQVSATGWLHMIANGELRILLVDDQGKAVRLVVDETLGRTFGGIRTLRGKRVTVSGIREAPEAIRVQTIQILETGKIQP